MSTYAVQRCVFDHLRRLERVRAGEPRPDIVVDGYDLADDERAALLAGDVGRLYALGTHPVLINGFCRSQGWKRADYRVLFDGVPAPAGGFEGRPRWQTS